MKYTFSFLLVIFLLNTKSFTQVFELSSGFFELDIDTINYVKNPSFEEYTECPPTIDRFYKCKHWNIAPGIILHTPNYFHRCANKYIGVYEVTVGIPRNVFGYQEPRTGDAYVGIATFTRNYYTENIQTQLRNPLIKGEKYIIGMHVNLAEKSKYANDRFTFCLTKESKLEIRHKRYKGTLKEQLICPNGITYISDTLITDTTSWVNIQVEYIAKGEEEFLTIGIFDGDISWWERRKKRRNIFNKNWDTYKYKVPGDYYFIDDVYVIRNDDYLNMMQNDENE